MLRILIIDDVETNRFVLRNIITDMGYQPVLAENGKQGLKIMERVLPDLILMDGGKGQVNIALSVLKELNINIPVCGMVKDDYHRTRALWYNDREIAIDTHSEGFKLLTRIQDEAHRFAITFHRNLRSKAQIHSVLDDI